MTAPSAPMDMAKFEQRRNELAEQLAAARTHRAALENRLSNASVKENFFGTSAPGAIAQLHAQLAEAEAQVVLLERLKASANDVANEIRIEEAHRVVVDAIQRAPAAHAAYEALTDELFSQLAGVLDTFDRLADAEVAIRELVPRSAQNALGLESGPGIPSAPPFNVSELLNVLAGFSELARHRRTFDVDRARVPLTRLRNDWRRTEVQRRELPSRLRVVKERADAAIARVKAGIQ